jgi:hypothetical protein
MVVQHAIYPCTILLQLEVDLRYLEDIWLAKQVLGVAVVCLEHH